MTYLHPGTVAAPDTDQEYVVVALDDGDSRDIHFSRVRYLPPGYPLIGETRHNTSYQTRLMLFDRESIILGEKCLLVLVLVTFYKSIKPSY